MRNNIFSVSSKSQNPLSYLLRQDAQRLAELAAYAPTVDSLEIFVGERMVETIAAIRREAPSLGTQLPGRTQDGHLRDIGDARVRTTRFFYEFEVVGDDELLPWWPDQNDDDLRPVNQGLMDEIGDESTASDEDMRRYYASIDWWTSRPRRSPDGSTVVVLTTWAELTDEELALPAKREEMADLFRQRHAEAERILSAIATQMTTFYDRELPELLLDRASARRAHLSNVEAAYKTLGLPAEWRMTTPRAVQVPEPSVPTVNRIEDLPIPTRWRLERSSYADIQRTVRAWADKVEEYAEAFTGLVEDRVSDLLCATLHATTSGAGREIFSRGGKSDIRIQASVLDEGTGPASIFVLESKWVDGKDDVESAIEDQLMRYVPVAATSTVFLALSRNADFGRAVESIRSWARDVSGYVGERSGDVEGWPIFTYEIAELANLPIDVCIATVALPRVPSTRAKKESAAKPVDGIKF